MLLGASLGSLYGIGVGFTEGTELWIYDGRVLGTTIFTYDGTELWLS